MKTLPLALFLALAAPMVPAAAQACGMYETKTPSRPADMLVFSIDQIENGSYGPALTAARRLVKHPNASAEQKAKGWTVIAWIRWANGQQPQAREALASAKEIDADAVIAVLGKIKAAEKKVTEELRAEASSVAVASVEP